MFRSLWSVWLVANICMWMNDVAAAWTMTSLTTSATLIALVQTASSLPVLLLGIPSGALADIINRKHYFLFAQIWLATNATALMLFLAFDGLNPYLLLLLTFTNGIGLAMRWPIFAAIVPDLVPRDILPSALALNAIAMNTSRIVGPLTAGAIIAAAGFVLLVLFLAVPILKLGNVLDEARNSLRDINQAVPPLLSELTDTVTETNKQLAKVDVITENVAEVTTNISSLVAVFSATVGSPLVKIAGLTQGLLNTIGGKSKK